jgi:hypothetical protein
MWVRNQAQLEKQKSKLLCEAIGACFEKLAASLMDEDS